MVKKVKSKKSDYELCKSKSIDKVMKLYEKGNLIIRGKKVINQKQAIAIGLQQAESNCKSKMNGSDIQNIVKKVERINKDKPYTYSDIKRILFLINYYQKKKMNVKVNHLYEKIINYLLTNNELKNSYRKLLLNAFKSKN
jgi:hypothetical protein